VGGGVSGEASQTTRGVEDLEPRNNRTRERDNDLRLTLKRKLLLQRPKKRIQEKSSTLTPDGSDEL